MGYSGRFVIRLNEDLHRQLSRAASKRAISLNRICVDFLQEGLKQSSKAMDPYEFLQPLLKRIGEYFHKDLVGVLVFGSRVAGQSTDVSDWDLLIVL